MTVLGMGDLASSLLARRNNADLKGEFLKLTQELSTGRKSDISQYLAGNTSPLLSLEHSLTLMSAYEVTQSYTGQKLNYAEIALDTIAADMSGQGAALLAGLNAGGPVSDATILGSSSRFESAISALSVRFSGSYLFSGISSQTPPYAPANTFIAELTTVTSGTATASDFLTAVDDWFSQPGGFNTIGYTGGSTSGSGVKVTETLEIDFGLTGQDDEIRETLQSLAILALVEQDAFVGDSDQKAEIIRVAAERLIANETELTTVQAELGVLQSSVSDASAQNLAQKNALLQMKNEIVSVDLFEVASKFEETQLQLESFYLATSKSARLSLTEYLR